MRRQSAVTEWLEATKNCDKEVTTMQLSHYIARGLACFIVYGVTVLLEYIDSP